MRVSAAIMAHPDRAEMVHDLRSTLDREVPVVWDHRGPPSGKGDKIWAVAREAWDLHHREADFHVLIQDDAVVCADFLAGVEKALEHVPADALVSPYLGKGRNVPGRWTKMARRADEQGASWVRSHILMWGVSIIAPVAEIPEMIDWCDRKAGMSDDMRVGRYFMRRKIDTWYTWPSLVDHHGGLSLAKHRHTDRVAVNHHPGSALELSWDGPVVLDPMIARSRGPRSGPRRR